MFKLNLKFAIFKNHGMGSSCLSNTCLRYAIRLCLLQQGFGIKSLALVQAQPLSATFSSRLCFFRLLREPEKKVKHFIIIIIAALISIYLLLHLEVYILLTGLICIALLTKRLSIFTWLSCKYLKILNLDYIHSHSICMNMGYNNCRKWLFFSLFSYK